MANEMVVGKGCSIQIFVVCCYFYFYQQILFLNHVKFGHEISYVLAHTF